MRWTILGLCLLCACGREEPRIDAARAELAARQLARIPAAVRLFEAGDYDRAIQAFGEISAALPDATHAATMAVLLGMPDAAAYRRVRASVYNNLGLSLYRARRFDAAVEEHRRAAAADPRSGMAFRNLAKVFIQQRRFEEALAAIAAVERRAGADPELSLDQGTVARELGRYDLARAALERALGASRPPQTLDDLRVQAHAWHQFGLLELDQGEVAAAIGAFDAALEHLPGLVPARYQLARALGLAGRIHDAEAQQQRFEADSAQVAAIQGVLAASPGRVDALAYVASSYEAIGDYPLAAAHYRQLLARDPADPDARQALERLEARASAPP